MLQVFFIDDDKPTTIVNKRLAKRSQLFDTIKVFNNSAKAFDYLVNHKKDVSILPDLIFLDVNMPAFNGWEFLKAFNKEEFSKKITIIMLSTSDSDKILGVDKLPSNVALYETKPLTISKIENYAKMLV